MRSNKTGGLMLARPWQLGIRPLFYVLYVASHRWKPFGANPNMVYNGAQNLPCLVFDPEFLLFVALTLKFAFFAVGSEVVRGYFLAQLLRKISPARPSSAPFTPCR